MFSLCCLTSNARPLMGELYVCSNINGFTSNAPMLWRREDGAAQMKGFTESIKRNAPRLNLYVMLFLLSVCCVCIFRVITEHIYVIRLSYFLLKGFALMNKWSIVVHRDHTVSLACLYCHWLFRPRCQRLKHWNLHGPMNSCGYLQWVSYQSERSLSLPLPIRFYLTDTTVICSVGLLCVCVCHFYPVLSQTFSHRYHTRLLCVCVDENSSAHVSAWHRKWVLTRKQRPHFHIGLIYSHKCNDSTLSCVLIIQASNIVLKQLIPLCRGLNGSASLCVWQTACFRSYSACCLVTYCCISISCWPVCEINKAVGDY